MESPTRLFLIRHGEVEAAYHRVFGGRIDMELSPFGHEQAQALAEYLQRYPFDAIYASPMKRVQQTLRALVAQQNKKATVLEALRELDFGEWTGLSWEEVEQRFRISAFTWLEQIARGGISGAEPLPHFHNRVQTAFQRILGEQKGRTVAVVAHGGVIRMALSILLDFPLVKTAQFEVEYASITVIDWLPGKSELELLNFTPWRDLA